MEAVAADLAARAPTPVPGWSAAVQAGVVTNPQDDARAQAFFEAHGYRARTVGWPDLGRRVLVEASSPDGGAADRLRSLFKPGSSGRISRGT